MVRLCTLSLGGGGHGSIPGWKLRPHVSCSAQLKAAGYNSGAPESVFLGTLLFFITNWRVFTLQVGFCLKCLSCLYTYISSLPSPTQDLNLNAEVRVFQGCSENLPLSLPGSGRGTGHCPILKASLLTGSQNSALYFEFLNWGWVT